MILDAIINLLADLIDGLVDLLPEWTVNFDTLGGAFGANSPMGDGLETQGMFKALLAFLSKGNTFVPFDQLILLINFLVTLILVIIGYRITRFTIGVLRGSGN